MRVVLVQLASRVMTLRFFAAMRKNGPRPIFFGL